MNATLSRKRRFFFSRILGLFLSLALALDQPAYALRLRQGEAPPPGGTFLDENVEEAAPRASALRSIEMGEQRGGLEELTGAIQGRRPSHSPAHSTTGLEEPVEIDEWVVPEFPDKQRVGEYLHHIPQSGLRIPVSGLDALPGQRMVVFLGNNDLVIRRAETGGSLEIVQNSISKQQEQEYPRSKPLQEGVPMILGRLPTVAQGEDSFRVWDIQKDFISRRHLRVLVRDGFLYLENLKLSGFYSTGESVATYLIKTAIAAIQTQMAAVPSAPLPGPALNRQAALENIRAWNVDPKQNVQYQLEWPPGSKETETFQKVPGEGVPISRDLLRALTAAVGGWKLSLSDSTGVKDVVLQMQLGSLSEGDLPRVRQIHPERPWRIHVRGPRFGIGSNPGKQDPAFRNPGAQMVVAGQEGEVDWVPPLQVEISQRPEGWRVLPRAPGAKVFYSVQGVREIQEGQVWWPLEFPVSALVPLGEQGLLLDLGEAGTVRVTLRNEDPVDIRVVHEKGTEKVSKPPLQTPGSSVSITTAGESSTERLTVRLTKEGRVEIKKTEGIRVAPSGMLWNIQQLTAGLEEGILRADKPGQWTLEKTDVLRRWAQGGNQTVTIQLDPFATVPEGIRESLWSTTNSGVVSKVTLVDAHIVEGDPAGSYLLVRGVNLPNASSNTRLYLSWVQEVSLDLPRVGLLASSVSAAGLEENAAQARRALVEFLGNKEIAAILPLFKDPGQPDAFLSDAFEPLRTRLRKLGYQGNAWLLSPAQLPSASLTTRRTVYIEPGKEWTDSVGRQLESQQEQGHYTLVSDSTAAGVVIGDTATQVLPSQTLIQVDSVRAASYVTPALLKHLEEKGLLIPGSIVLLYKGDLDEDVLLFA